MHVHKSLELLILYFKGSLVGLPHLQTLVNINRSYSNQNNSVYTKLPDRFLSLCRSVKSQIFFLKFFFSKMYLVQIFEIDWLGVVMIATWADSIITDIFFSCKCVINELTCTRHTCQSSHMHQYTPCQEVKKKAQF